MQVHRAQSVPQSGKANKFQVRPTAEIRKRDSVKIMSREMDVRTSSTLLLEESLHRAIHNSDGDRLEDQTRTEGQN